MKLIKLLLTIAIMASVNLSATVIWQADFESPTYQIGTLITQESWSAFTTYGSGNDVTNDNVYAGLQSLRLFESVAGNTDYSMVKHSFDVNGIDATNSYVKISCAVWPSSLYDGLRIYNAAWDASALVAMRDTGIAYGGASFPNNYGEWNQVGIVFDTLNQKAIQLSVNGEIASINEKVFVPAGLRLSAQLTSPYPDTNMPVSTYFDDLTVETIPSFRVDYTAGLIYTTADPQNIEISTEFDPLAYDVTLSTDQAWINLATTSTNVDYTGVAVAVTVDTTGQVLPISGKITITGPEGQEKIVTVAVRSPLIAYDGFDGTILGECITNVASGTGFVTPWTATPSSGGFFPETEDVIVAGLEYSTNDVRLLTSGNAAYIIPADGDNKGFNMQRNLVNDLSGDQTLWVSLLLKATINFNACGKFIKFASSEGSAFGEQWSPSWKFVNGNAIGPAVELDKTYFIVTKYVISSGAGTAYMFINPDIAKEPTTSQATGTQSRSMAMSDFVNWRVLHNQLSKVRGGIIFDELRIGDTWDSVVPVNLPTNVKASDGTYEDKVEITWNEVPGASKYSVYRAMTNDSSVATLLDSNITTNIIEDTSASVLTIYYYWVKSDVSSAFSASDDGYRAAGDLPLPPENLAASQGTLEDSILVTWDLSAKATKYQVYRSTVDSFNASTIITNNLTNLELEDHTITKGAQYYYWVKAGNESGWSFASDSVSGYTEYTASICYEGFDYPTGFDLNGLTGGLGFDGAWGAGAVSTISAEGLVYPGLKTSGRSVKIMAISSRLTTSRNTVADFGGGDELWYSFLIRRENLEVGGFFLTANGQNRAGKSWGNYYSIHNSNSEVFAEPGETFLLVVRNTGATGSALWINPSLEDEPLAGAADATSSQAFASGNIFGMNLAHYGASNTFTLDEIRFGNTWAEVTPNYLVKNVQASDGTYTDKVSVTWTPRSDATSYVVYRNTSDDSSTAVAVSGDLTTASFDDTTGIAGTLYYYWVYATFDDGEEAFSYSTYGYRAVAGAPLPPANLVASDAVPDQKYINITFDVSAGATGYRILRNTTDDYAAAENISGDILGNRYLDYSVKAGVKYYYWVRAQNANGWSNFGDSDSGSMPAILIAYYAMDELTSTNMLDSSENEFNGIYRDEPILGIPSADAELFKTAVQFSVSDATINSNTPIRDLTNNFTVAMWVNPEEISDSEYRYLIGLRSEVGGWSVQIYKDEVLLDITGKGSGWTTAEAVAVDQWNHIAFSFDNNNEIRSFVNGVPREQSTKIGMPADYVKSTTYIANGALDTLYFGGLDEIRVYNGVLTDEGIAELAGVPEPTTILLVATMLLGLLFRRNR